MQLVMKKKEEREKAKFPKLVITKFDGTYFDWFRFCNQFASQIDNYDSPQVSKFSYLKDLLIPKICFLIDSLSFTSEGYTRAKNILMTMYGKPSEDANAHVQNIMSLPQINNGNSQKINDFSEKLLCSKQALDIMGE